MTRLWKPGSTGCKNNRSDTERLFVRKAGRPHGAVGVHAGQHRGAGPGRRFDEHHRLGPGIESVHCQPIESRPDHRHRIDGANAMRFSDSGTSSFLSDTNDGTLLAFAAYNTTTSQRSDLATATATDARAVGTLDTNGNFTLQTTYTESTSRQSDPFGDEPQRLELVHHGQGRFVHERRHDPQPHDEHSEHQELWRHRLRQLHKSCCWRLDRIEPDSHKPHRTAGPRRLMEAFRTST